MTSKSQVSSSADCLDKVASQVSNEESCNFVVDTSTFRKENLLDRVSFKKENFVESLHGGSEEYDSIICLSVTKWIHLNWGDDGLIKLFVKIWRLLRPGGIFVLEPQPWSSYKRNRLVSETAKMNFNDILIHPDRFRELLLDKIGFRSAETVTDSLSGTVAGFDRPIMVFVK